MMYGEHKPDNISLQAGRMLDWGFAVSRSAGPVGTLVPPADPSTPTPSAGPSGSAPAAAVGQDTTSGGSGTPVALLGAGLVALLALGWGGFAVLRRRT